MNSFLPISQIAPQLLIPSVTQFDKKLAVSILLGIGLSWAMNKLSSIKLLPLDQAVLYWTMPVAVLVNQLWKQTIVSQLPAAQNNHFLKVAVSPWTFLATYALSKISSSSFYEWPTAIATASVVGLDVLRKSNAAIHNHDFSACLVHLFNGVGTGLLMLDTLGLKQILDRKSWAKMNIVQENSNDLKNKWLDQEIIRIRFKTAQELKETNIKLKQTLKNLEELKKEPEKFKKELKETLDEISRQVREKGEREWQWILESIFGMNQPQVVPQNCAAVDANVYKNLSDLQRITHPTLNPLCPKHAKIMLASNGLFDEKSFLEKTCDYVNSIYKKMMVATHPDVNRKQPELAQKAFETIQQAAQTLCPRHS